MTTMAFKRLVGIIAAKNGKAVKSYGYRTWRPAGSVKTALQNLDRWQVDEIVVLDISGRGLIDPRIVSEIRYAKVMTPITYGGGIRTPDDLTGLLAIGCERFVLETLLFQSPSDVWRLADKVGEQALIASLPLVRAADNSWRVKLTSSNTEENKLTSNFVENICNTVNELPISEVLAIDREHEGHEGAFTLLNEPSNQPLQALKKGIIWFGGIGVSQAEGILSAPLTVAVGFGNLNFEREQAIPLLRRKLLESSVRELVRKTYDM